ncbi:alpha-N-arabinofuranosidase [Massilia antarctica]|uniref:alpha-N-arabinofuranosidase n=1 Tax=Massilia antarctica TaxID=2765360 RepID=UPI0006BB8423|nr:alpha-L-arabinofuranosidase C-terminal domain-containing protein [Massilia sp. H27-R4]MCY0911564.1 alpha-N-arabinofuranosidase [Massilia sp. H27-R4]CUI04818.1 Alpha-N-arabinofuranosidase 2 [Janthinobacterium sp. CG23_2]CUU28604.1 Alpha-N-arabinofuranosidase 2 [Janthinobacterium sp. CG23_2]
MNIIKQSIAAISLVTISAWPAFAANQVSVTIDAGKPGAVINKNVYGQFAEHLGTGIYEGMYVGTGSKIPNTKGWRNDVVGALKQLHVPLVRWPGGCFADEYHWKDGVGPRAKRPVKVNTNWGGVEESNAVGTHEFFDLVDLLGADAYVNGNLGSGSVQEMADWVEYMTSDSKSSLANLRRKNGHEKPFKVAYFAIGNEAWGCGGNMTPEHYTNLYRNYETMLKAPKESRPLMIASGGNDDDTKWTDVISKNAKAQTTGISFHYYTIPTGKWEGKGAAPGFAEPHWISTLANTLKIESMIKSNVAVLDKNDPEKKLGLYVDEWGTWYDVETGTTPGFLYQQNTLRDAVVAALNFNIFHQHADRVRMTNIAQMVNVLQAMILTEKDKMLLTPTYHAFHMYVPFQDATSLPVTVADDKAYTLGDTTIPGISASAARAKDGKLYLSLVNTNPGQPADVVVNVAGKQLASANGQVLTATAMDAHNTFQNPQAIKPAPFSAKASGGKLTVTVPAKAVVVVALEG